MILLALVPAALGSTSQGAAATTPETVTIEQHSSRGCFIPCTFVATGAVSDSRDVTFESSNATALPSPVVGTGHFIRTYHGRNGTLTIKLETLLTLCADSAIRRESGHWVLVGATGACAGLHGLSHEEGTRNLARNTLDAVFTDQVH